MKAIILMFDSLNRHMLEQYADTFVDAPNFARLAARTTRFDNFYAGSMPCMPARRELHTGRYNFLHRSWGPLEPFDDSMPQMLRDAGIHTHLASDHPHYWEDGGATYHTRYTTWEFFRGQEGDPWKGHVGTPSDTGGQVARIQRQDRINRMHMPTEAEHSQTRTVEAGIEFIDTNAAADDWLLQIELFDPHEPFFTHQHYKDRYPHAYDGPEFDWPAYRKVTESPEQVDHARHEYAALVSMCDRSLGRVLDAMDEHDLWDDTLLIVNTDHGFLLGEHGWWAKSVQPWFNELVHLPMFLWDPRSGDRGGSRGDLAQTIDIAPTVLRWFGIEPTDDMQGRDLATETGHEAALFGIHGGHVNVTDGRYVYMRAAADRSNRPLEEHTLMPTHMRARFSVAELAEWEPSDPLPFTKGVRVMRMPAAPTWMNPWQHGTLLFDLHEDPEQEHPLRDDALELRMMRLLARRMHDSHAPRSQFDRLGLPYDSDPDEQHLLVAAQAERAAAVGAPLSGLGVLETSEVLRVPVLELLAIGGTRHVFEELAPGLTTTELIAVPPGTTLLDLAAAAMITATDLEEFAQRLDALVGADR
ncbi:sulfatase [Saccharopolyspora sp. TS4A08]|uniref:Sulfatase n=1 Tax=Saccharopolyspora ipomoeae TaxID=3042027 RepID=A0ABT6PL28_9PSEU|nr:sulfatase [Saccharopolyspora sp. TS4A08]MDI2028196.1 sulfatase [Saccharopolyspora sp. TS4A08]